VFFGGKHIYFGISKHFGDTVRWEGHFYPSRLGGILVSDDDDDDDDDDDVFRFILLVLFSAIAPPKTNFLSFFPFLFFDFFFMSRLHNSISFVFFLLFNNFIPISLYVTIELVNLGQAFMVAADDLIYDETLNCACIVRSSNLVQELGMVSNVFSDKTGTLTRNEMKFVNFVVEGRMFDVLMDGVLSTEEARGSGNNTGATPLVMSSGNFCIPHSLLTHPRNICTLSTHYQCIF